VRSNKQTLQLYNRSIDSSYAPQLFDALHRVQSLELKSTRFISLIPSRSWITVPDYNPGNVLYYFMIIDNSLWSLLRSNSMSPENIDVQGIFKKSTVNNTLLFTRVQCVWTALISKALALISNYKCIGRRAVVIIIVSLLMSPLLGHKHSLLITHKGPVRVGGC
jgi:hypothetical protein